MNEPDNGPASRKRFGVLKRNLVAVVILLFLVPPACLVMALLKSGWHPLRSPQEWKVVPVRPSQSNGNIAKPSVSPETESATDDSLRKRLEEIASKVISLPTVGAGKMTQVRIQPSGSATTTLEEATDSVRGVLRDHGQQFVEAVNEDSIRLVVVLPSDQWKGLSEDLRTAADKMDMIYWGPSQLTSTSDKTVAEIEIFKKGRR